MEKNCHVVKTIGKDVIDMDYPNVLSVHWWY